MFIQSEHLYYCSEKNIFIHLALFYYCLQKKFLEHHRKLMDDFMTDHETEALEIKQQHQKELDEQKASLATEYTAIINDLRSQLQYQEQQLHQTVITDPDFSTSSAQEQSFQGEIGQLRRQIEVMKRQQEESIKALQEEYETKMAGK